MDASVMILVLLDVSNLATGGRRAKYAARKELRRRYPWFSLRSCAACETMSRLLLCLSRQALVDLHSWWGRQAMPLAGQVGMESCRKGQIIGVGER